MKKSEKQTCANCAYQKNSEHHETCRSCVKLHPMSLNDNWKKVSTKYYEIMAEGEAIENHAVGADFYYPDDHEHKDQLVDQLGAKGLYVQVKEIPQQEWEHERERNRRKNMRLMGMR